MKEGKVRTRWIDCVRCIAILAVLVDHTRGRLYSNQDIQMASFFSVSLLILIMGMTSYISHEMHKERYVSGLWRRNKKIFINYLIATFVYLIYTTHFFDLKEYVTYVLHFNISGPFYFVLLFFQLSLTSYFLFWCVSNFTLKGVGGLFLIILGVSIFSTQFTNIYDIYGGGGKLLGGTYLILFYTGMIVQRYGLLERVSRLKSIIIAICSSALWFFWWRYICGTEREIDRFLPFGEGINPPGLSLMILALLTLLSAYGIFTLSEQIKILTPLVSLISFVGRHTLEIFMYHILVRDILDKYIVIANMNVKRIVYLCAMIFIPIAFCRLGKLPHNVQTRFEMDDK